jgi:ATP-dependent Clp protease adaptor protein ClpS
MNNDIEYAVLTDQLEETVEKTVRERDLIIYNDDYNTFDFVIESLMEVCDHDLEQAEQCTYIIHYNGKCAVKSGSYTKLNPMRITLCERGLSAVIQ